LKYLKEGSHLRLSLDNRIVIFDDNFFSCNSEVSIKSDHGHYKIHELRFSKESIVDDVDVKSGDPLIVKLKAKSGSNKIFFSMHGFKDEHIYGGGEQYKYLDLKNKSMPIWVQEKGVGKGYDLLSFLAYMKGVRGNWYSTYFPAGIFYSSKGYAILVKNYDLMKVSFKNYNFFEVWSDELEIAFFEGENIRSLIQKMISYIGQEYSELPEWAYEGVWIASQGGIETAQNKIKAAKDRGIPVNVIWCQDWSGKKITSFGKQVYWNWQYDKQMYEELPQKIISLNNTGVKFLAYINPFLIDQSPLYIEGEEKGYFVKNKSGSAYKVYVTTFPAGLVDLTNPDAVKWYKQIIRNNMINIGISGWMADFGEYMPDDVITFSKQTGIDFHNEYPVQWAKLNSDIVNESGKKDILFFMRAGFTGSTKYCPVYWGGDQSVNWSKSDGLPTIIPAGLSLGFSGVRYYHFDCGGYTSLFHVKRTEEFFMRWSEVAAFSLIMRTHEGNRPYKNLQYDSNKKIFDHFALMSNVHASLKAYLKYSVYNSIQENLPVMKHPFLIYQDYPENLKYQYLLGNELLVSPVVRPHVKTWNVYLPKGKWIHLWSGKLFNGGNYVNVDSPIGKPPVFIVESSSYAEEMIKNVQFVGKKFNL
jgi:alpha-glucosidase